MLLTTKPCAHRVASIFACSDVTMGFLNSHRGICELSVLPLQGGPAGLAACPCPFQRRQHNLSKYGRSHRRCVTREPLQSVAICITACQRQNMCWCRKRQVCQAQAGSIQEKIRGFTEFIPLEGWQLNIIVTTCAILAGYTALQILLWDYRVSTAGFQGRRRGCQSSMSTFTPFGIVW